MKRRACGGPSSISGCSCLVYDTTITTVIDHTYMWYAHSLRLGPGTQRKSRIVEIYICKRFRVKLKISAQSGVESVEVDRVGMRRRHRAVVAPADAGRVFFSQQVTRRKGRCCAGEETQAPTVLRTVDQLPTVPHTHGPSPPGWILS